MAQVGARRLFVACLLPAVLARETLAAATAPLSGEAFRFPRADGLHFTLFFLGDVAGERARELETALGRALAGARAPRLCVRGTDAFPRRGAERVLWMGAREADGGARLAELHRRVLEGVEAAGFDTEAERRRTYRPHVTVARPRARGSVPGAFYAVDFERDWQPEAVSLVESVKVARGAGEYRAVWTHRLER